MLETVSFCLPPLTSWQKSRMLGHAKKVLTAQQHMTTNKGKNILHYTLKKQRRHLKMNHYPKGDRIDHLTGAQYFYHCHRENYQSEEHGHFHCFLRYKHIPSRIKPKLLNDWDKYIDNPMTHLVAIALNCYGQPIRLFTVNRWVTSEIWYDAKHMERFIHRFKITLKDDPYWQVLDQWINSTLALFSPQIAWLHQQRDLAIHYYQNKNNHENVYENNEIEELSSIPIDLTQQIQWIMMP